MKISASLPEDDVEFLDRYASDHQESRSAVLHRAVRMLRFENLGDQYEASWASDSGTDWDATLGDELPAQ